MALYIQGRFRFRVNTYPSPLQGVVGLVLLILRGRAENLSDSVYLCDRLDTGF